MENFLNNILSSIGLNDVLDILIVAFLVYKVLGFIRETRAEQLAKGIVVLVGATLLSSRITTCVIGYGFLIFLIFIRCTGCCQE